MMRNFAKEDCPVHFFGTGNKQTLETDLKEKGIDLRAALLDFHKKVPSSCTIPCTLRHDTNAVHMRNIVFASWITAAKLIPWEFVPILCPPITCTMIP